MVAPALVTRPTRVFARITFTGEDKNLPPVCCDLSRVATIAAASPLPNNLGNTIVQESSSSKLYDPMLLRALEQSAAAAPNSLLPEKENINSHSESKDTSVSDAMLNKSRKRPLSSQELSSVPAKSARRQEPMSQTRAHGLNQRTYNAYCTVNSQC